MKHTKIFQNNFQDIIKWQPLVHAAEFSFIGQDEISRTADISHRLERLSNLKIFKRRICQFAIFSLDK